MIVIVWHLLADPEATYEELGADFFDRRSNTEARQRQLIRHPRTRSLTRELQHSDRCRASPSLEPRRPRPPVPLRVSWSGAPSLSAWAASLVFPSSEERLVGHECVSQGVYRWLLKTLKKKKQ